MSFPLAKLDCQGSSCFVKSVQSWLIVEHVVCKACPASLGSALCVPHHSLTCCKDSFAVSLLHCHDLGDLHFGVC